MKKISSFVSILCGLLLLVGVVAHASINTGSGTGGTGTSSSSSGTTSSSGGDFSYTSILPTCEEQGLHEDPFEYNQNTPWVGQTPSVRLLAWNYCDLANQVDHDILEKLQEIKEQEDKGFIDLLRETGELFCWGVFSKCGTGETTFYSRLLQSCSGAFEAMQSDSRLGDALISSTDPVLTRYFQQCRSLAREKMVHYKQSAYIQIIKNQIKLLEGSNLATMRIVSDQMREVHTVKDTVFQKFVDAANHFEGFTDPAAGGNGTVEQSLGLSNTGISDTPAEPIPTLDLGGGSEGDIPDLEYE